MLLSTLSTITTLSTAFGTTRVPQASPPVSRPQHSPA